jgi:hypothetical protein
MSADIEAIRAEVAGGYYYRHERALLAEVDRLTDQRDRAREELARSECGPGRCKLLRVALAQHVVDADTEQGFRHTLSSGLTYQSEPPPPDPQVTQQLDEIRHAQGAAAAQGRDYLISGDTGGDQ